MLERQLNLRYDPAQELISLDCGTFGKRSLRSRKGFNAVFAREAVLTTGMVDAEESGLVLRSESSLTTLVDVVTKMLDYFNAADEPSADLRRVKEVIDRQYLSDSPSPALSWLAYAWLDVMVRENLACDARDAADVWTNRLLTLDAEQHCDRLVQEILRRQERFAAEMHRPRMSPRVNERSQQQSETG